MLKEEKNIQYEFSPTLLLNTLDWIGIFKDNYLISTLFSILSVGLISEWLYSPGWVSVISRP